jgi:hypothetical protein
MIELACCSLLHGKTKNEIINQHVCGTYRALGDLTGIKKHFSRKHGEKLWRCDRCGKRYAVRSDWKAHVKGCGTREYRCDCGNLFSRWVQRCILDRVEMSCPQLLDRLMLAVLGTKCQCMRLLIFSPWF